MRHLLTYRSGCGGNRTPGSQTCSRPRSLSSSKSLTRRRRTKYNPVPVVSRFLDLVSIEMGFLLLILHDLLVHELGRVHRIHRSTKAARRNSRVLYLITNEDEEEEQREETTRKRPSGEGTLCR